MLEFLKEPLLPTLRDDTVFLCGHCRIMRYTALTVGDGRNICSDCGETMMKVNHEMGRLILCSVAYAHPEKPSLIRKIMTFGKEGQNQETVYIMKGAHWHDGTN